MSDPTSKQFVNRSPRKGFVYLIGVREAPNYFKIGQTLDLHHRLQSLDGGNHQTLYLVWSLATNYPLDSERALHHHFKAKRFKKEWFKLLPEDLEWLRTLSESDLVDQNTHQAQPKVLPIKDQDFENDIEDVVDAEDLYDLEKLQAAYRDEHYSGRPRYANPMLRLDGSIAYYKELGFSNDWLLVKFEIKLQKLFPESIFRYYAENKRQYDLLMEELRVGLWKRSTAVLKSQMGLKQAGNLRHYQTPLALSYELLAENMSAYELERQQ
jgi:hypothetical protein